MKLIWTAGIQMKWRCDHRSCNRNLSNCKFWSEKIVRASTGFQPAMISALALQCSTNWAMKTHMLGIEQFIEFILTRDRNETWIEVDLNCGNTDEMMHCNANAETMGSNPVDALNFFSGKNLQLRKLRLQLRWFHFHFFNFFFFFCLKRTKIVFRTWYNKVQLEN